MNPAWMAQAIRLSAQGYPAPNPHVGCVIVRDGEVVGTGFHGFAGGPHAEVAALQEAGDLAHGADVYVTLEPCNHTGRTPPCSRALIEARVQRVFVAVRDPNSVASGGAEALEIAGIEVHIGLMAAEAVEANRQFLDSVALGRPVVTIKAGISLDGCLALTTGESKWITGPESRERAMALRAQCGAVLVGCKTVLADDPELTARVPGVVNQPVRVVLDPHARLTGTERVFNGSAQTVHVRSGPIVLKELLGTLSLQGVRGLLVEGGATTIGHWLESGLVDRLALFIAPKLLGQGVTWTGDLRIGALTEAVPLQFDSITSSGADVMIQATFLRNP